MNTLKKLFKKSVASFFHNVSSNVPLAKYPTAHRKYEAIYKTYPLHSATSLPHSVSMHKSLEKCLDQRKTVRTFHTKKVSLSTISTILRYSVGMKNNTSKPLRRMYPSPGALYSLETYLIGNNTESKVLSNHITHYNVTNHTLEIIARTTPEYISKCFLPLNQETIRDCTALIVITACFDRIFRKYTERGYRYALIEAGHVAQNIYLSSTALTTGCCGLGSYYDSRINKLLNLDENEKTLYVLALGSP